MVSVDFLTKASLNLARASVTAKNWAVSSGQSAGHAAVGAKNWVFDNPKTTAGVVAAPAVAVAAVPLALGAAGFTAGGIAAGSVAAGVQAGIGNVAAGSLFAGLTSAGMGGAALATVQGVAGGAAVVVASGSALFINRSGNKTDGKEEEDVEGEETAAEVEGKVEAKL